MPALLAFTPNDYVQPASAFAARTIGKLPADISHYRSNVRFMPGQGDARYNPHLRLTWGGDIGVPGVEQWTNGIRLVDFGDGSLPSDDELQTGLNYIAPFIEGWFQSPDMRIGDAARLAWAKLNIVNEQGLQPGNTIRHDFASSIFGSFNQNPDWNQTFAITFRTAKQRGRAHAGRIFPPLVGYNPQAKSPYIDPVAANILATATGGLLNSITVGLHSHWVGAGQIGGPGEYQFEPAVVSPGSVAANTQEMREKITSVVVDRVPDTQHRRTKQVPRAEGSPFVIPYA